MGVPGRRNLARLLSSLAIAAICASALALALSTLAFATTTDVIVVNPNSGTAIHLTEGTSMEGPVVVGTFTDPGNTGANVDCTTTRLAQYHVTLKWGDGDTSDGAVACQTDSGGTFTVSGSHRYIDSGSYPISVGVVDTKDDGTSGVPVNTDTATVTDATISFDLDNGGDSGQFVSVEGKAVSIIVDFTDFNSAFPTEAGTMDPGLSGTIDWGDNSGIQTVSVTHTPSADCDCSRDFRIAASHVYDAPVLVATIYNITITGKDDGGSSDTDTLTAKISDGKLTAGANQTLTASPTKAFTSVVGSFSDEAAAQAKTADFHASVNWGDNTTSPGTVAQTASGTFSVSGTHTYAGGGAKSITAIVTDEEGSVVTLHATANVVVLPTTGQPRQPLAPVWLVLVLTALLFVGLASLGGGLAINRFDRARR